MVNETFTKKALYVLCSVWALLFAPSILLIILAKTQHLIFNAEVHMIQQLLFYNTLFFPVMIIISIVSTLLFLKKKHYQAAFMTSLLPFLNIIIEIIVADIALLLI